MNSKDFLTLFLPAKGGISPYMSVTWPSLVEIGLKGESLMPVEQNIISKNNTKILWNILVLKQGNFHDQTHNNRYVHLLLQYINLSIFFRIPEASSLMLNIILSDTIFNVFRDHNFDSCTICVCSNEGNIRGRDAAPYLPNFQGDDDCVCCCGFSALSNRKLAHQSGLFYEVRKKNMHTYEAIRKVYLLWS